LKVFQDLTRSLERALAAPKLHNLMNRAHESSTAPSRRSNLCAEASIDAASPRITSTFAQRRSIRRMGLAVSLGLKRRGATWGLKKMMIAPIDEG